MNTIRLGVTSGITTPKVRQQGTLPQYSSGLTFKGAAQSASNVKKGGFMNGLRWAGRLLRERFTRKSPFEFKLGGTYQDTLQRFKQMGMAHETLLIKKAPAITVTNGAETTTYIYKKNGSLLRVTVKGQDCLTVYEFDKNGLFHARSRRGQNHSFIHIDSNGMTYTTSKEIKMGEAGSVYKRGPVMLSSMGDGEWTVTGLGDSMTSEQRNALPTEILDLEQEYPLLTLKAQPK
jgi:hypothetical protein